MKITQYYDIYIRFLSKVEDDYLASLDDEQMNTALYPILLSAINSFARISEHNLRHRDERNRVFYDTLTEDEIEVLAILMKPVWLERYINNSRKIEQQYYDAGIKTYSPNENLRNLTVLYQQYLADGRKALTEYTYKRVSIVGNLGGLPKNDPKNYTPGPTIHNGDYNDPIRMEEEKERRKYYNAMHPEYQEHRHGNGTFCDGSNNNINNNNNNNNSLNNHNHGNCGHKDGCCSCHNHTVGDVHIQEDTPTI